MTCHMMGGGSSHSSCEVAAAAAAVRHLHAAPAAGTGSWQLRWHVPAPVFLSLCEPSLASSTCGRPLRGNGGPVLCFWLERTDFRSASTPRCRYAVPSALALLFASD
ncbi:unnamed protein product, partial [Phaeothamnion confervicola]